MSRRVLVAALVTMGLGAGAWAYEAWPAWYGQAIVLQGLLGSRDARTGRTPIEFAAARLKLDLPDAFPDDSPVPFYLVKQIDSIWPAGANPVQSARLMQRRVIYVQMERQSDGAGPSQPEGPYVPVSVSHTPVAGAINLRARVTKAAPTGRFDVALAPPLIPVPPGRDDNTFVPVVIRVLPSGRHAIVRLH